MGGPFTVPRESASLAQIPPIAVNPASGRNSGTGGDPVHGHGKLCTGGFEDADVGNRYPWHTATNCHFRTTTSCR